VALNGAKIVTKEEAIAAINECAARLGHAPTSTELRKSANLGKYDIRKYFGTYAKALDACGMEARGAGYEVTLKTLFLGWAGVVRELGKAPTMEEYDKRSKNRRASVDTASRKLDPRPPADDGVCQTGRAGW
jgi:hypothetical protein